MTAPKAYFAAVPARALYDRRLDGGRFQLLAAIALSNRLGKGQGCWRSADTLSTMTGLDPGSVRNYIGDLTKWGYIIREPRPGTKTQRSLFVIYDPEADREALTRAKVSSANDTLRAKVSSGGAQSVISGNDTSESLERKIAQSARERNSAEAASVVNDTRRNVILLSDPEAVFLRKAERWLKAQPTRPYDAADIRTMRGLRDRCEQIALDNDGGEGDPIGGWAGRLCDEFHYIIDEFEDACSDIRRATRQ